MKIKNICPLGDVQPAALGLRLVKAGETIDVPEDVAAVLLVQTANWEPVKPSKSEAELIAKFHADHAEMLAAATPKTLAEAPDEGDVDEPTEETTTPDEGDDTEGVQE